MKKKMNLNNLQVESFVTSIASKDRLKGGTGTAINTDHSCPPTHLCSYYDDCDTITRRSERCNKTSENSKAEYTCDGHVASVIKCIV